MTKEGLCFKETTFMCCHSATIKNLLIFSDSK